MGVPVHILLKKPAKGLLHICERPSVHPLNVFCMVAWDHRGTRAHTCREDAHHADTAPYVVHADGGRSLMAQHLETGAPVYTTLP